MEQLFMFSGEISFPLSHEDIVTLFKTYVMENEKDPDAFTFSDIKNGKSYSLYGEKVLEHFPGSSTTARIGLSIIDSDGKKKFVKKKPGDLSSGQLLAYFEELKKRKHEIFRSLTTEQFACCNDFNSCSDAKRCLHPEDRFYNGCYYRKHLEAGRIFYGVNKTI